MSEEISFGAMLREARERRGETLEQAHQQTAISPVLLQELESGEFRVEPVYARLAAANYASYLGLDSEEITARFDLQFGRPDFPSPSRVYLGNFGPPNFLSPALNSILNRRTPPFWKIGAAAAATALAKFAELAGEGRLVRRDVQRISDALLTVVEREDEQVGTRCRAIEALAPLDSDRVHAIIEEAYSDPDLRLRQSAIFAMGRSSDSRWLPTVIKEMRNTDAALRYEAATACGFLGEDDTLPYLISLLNDEDSQVQLAAVRSLGAIGGDLARRALTQAMRRGDDAIEEAAEEALASIDFDDDPLGFRYEG